MVLQQGFKQNLPCYDSRISSHTYVQQASAESANSKFISKLALRFDMHGRTVPSVSGTRLGLQSVTLIRHSFSLGLDSVPLIKFASHKSILPEQRKLSKQDTNRPCRSIRLSVHYGTQLQTQQKCRSHGCRGPDLQ